MSKMKMLVLGIATAGVLLVSYGVTPAGATALRTLVLTTLTATTAAITTLTGTTATITTVSSTNLTATGPLKIYTRTKAQLGAITPAAGDTYLCSNCTAPYSLCVATAASLSSFARVQTGTVDTTKLGCGTNE